MFRLNKLCSIRVGAEKSYSPSKSKSANPEDESSKSEKKSAESEHCDLFFDRERSNTCLSLTENPLPRRPYSRTQS